MACGACCGKKGAGSVIVASSIAAMVPIWVVALDNDEDGATPEVETPIGSLVIEDDPRDVLGFEMQRIDGEMQELEAYRGRVLLLVNTASRCGYTRQYEGLEALYREKKDQGFAVLGFPANDFRGQEPGTDEEIAAFCSATFDVTFPMFSKITVIGDEAHPLYQKLAEQPDPIGGEPKWNFTKFLVDREGRVVARFEPNVEPGDEVLVEAIDGLLEVDAGGAPGGG